jgi:uncharacterized membrane protein (UPF0127 family)
MKWWVARTALAVLVIFVVGFFVIQKFSDDQMVLRMGDQAFNVTIARTDTERQRGLSGTKNLASNRAMLFIFPDNTRPGIWMKDMNYPIDILWVSANSQIVHIVKNAQPSSYPEIFRSDVFARYVIEVPSGTIERTGIVKGDLVVLPSGL